MEDFKNLPTDQLVEMMSTYTTDYTRMVKEGASDSELSNCEFVLNMIQSEVRFRRSSLVKNGTRSEKT